MSCRTAPLACGGGARQRTVLSGRPTFDEQVFHVKQDGCTVRRARIDDVPALVALLADDPLGRGREQADPTAYEAAFRLVDADANQFLACLTDGEDVVGTLQLTFIPGLSRGGRCGRRSRPSACGRTGAMSGSAGSCSTGPSPRPAGGGARSCS